MKKSKLNLNLVDETASLDIVPWKLSVPAVRFDLNSFKKDTTNPEIYKQFCLQLVSEYPLSDFFSTDGSKIEDGVAAAAVSTKRINKPSTWRLPDDSSIYTAELRAILLALRHVYYSKEKSFLILSDSLSSLQSIFNLSSDIRLIYRNDKIVFIWVPGHIALDSNISVELIPFSDLKSRTNKYILELWQSEWD